MKLNILYNKNCIHVKEVKKHHNMTFIFIFILDFQCQDQKIFSQIYIQNIYNKKSLQTITPTFRTDDQIKNT